MDEQGRSGWQEFRADLGSKFGWAFRGKKPEPESTEKLSPIEEKIQQTIFSQVIEKLSLDPSQKRSVLLTVASVVHMATMLLSRATKPEAYDLNNSPRFTETLRPFDEALAKAGITNASQVDEQVVKIISDALKAEYGKTTSSVVADAVEPQERSSPVRVEYKPAYVKQKALKITPEQETQATEAAKQANTVTIKPELQTRFDTALAALVKARAAVLKIGENAPYTLSETEFEKRRQLVEVLNEAKPGVPQENENIVLRAMIQAMDTAFGRNR